MSLFSVISTELIKVVAKKASEKAINGGFGKEKETLKKVLDELPTLFENHLVELINWSFDIPFIGLNSPKVVASSTIELSISPAISKFDSVSQELISENDLIAIKNNVLLLGHPGAGKTTTLKRLILIYFNYGHENFNYDLPILLRFRNFGSSLTIAAAILDLFSIPYSFKVIDVNEIVSEKVEIPRFLRGPRYEDVPPTESGNRKVIRTEFRTVQKTQIYVGDTISDIFIPQFLNQTRVLLILDGLDEAEQDVQSRYQKEIEQLALSLISSKIILTVRKSKLSDAETRFVKYELKPLTDSQILEIASKWLKDGIGFFNAVKKKPYSDLANRPIFLTLLILLYDKFKELPIQPNEVYRESTNLIIKEWDEHRGITRRSNYTNFSPSKKLIFLSDLSYCLTYIIKSKSFSRQTLEIVYKKIHASYYLPSDDMGNVVSEIESHNGLIIDSGYNSFEFSHLSIQEYLCAEYIVKLPISFETLTYFYDYPEPLAIAICISGDSSLWLSNLFLNKYFNLHANNHIPEIRKKYNLSLYAFFSRLIVEFPTFKKSESLGFTLISLFFNEIYEEKYNLLYQNLLKFTNVILSINQALQNYEIENMDANSDSIELRMLYGSPLAQQYYIHLKGTLYKSSFKEFQFTQTEHKKLTIVKVVI